MPRDDSIEPHDCLEFLTYRSSEWYETHGLDCGPYEHCFEEWWECSLCGETWTGKELDRLMAADLS